MTRIGVAFAAGMTAVLFATCGFAETPAAPAPPPPTARQMELAHRYVVATHQATNLEASIKANLPGLLTSLPAEQRQTMSDALAQAMIHMHAKLAPQWEAAIAETFSEAELTEVVGFLEGPVGQAATNNQPRVAARIAPIMMQVMSEWMSDIRDRACGPDHCSDDFKIKLCAQINCAARPYPIMLTWPPSSPPPTPRRLALARRCLAAMQDQKTYEASVKAALPRMKALAVGDRDFAAESATFLANVKTRVAPYKLAAFAEIYSDEELEALSAFYESPIGQTMLDRQPQIAAKLAAVSQTLVWEMVAEMMATVSKEAEPKAPPGAGPRRGHTKPS